MAFLLNYCCIKRFFKIQKTVSGFKCPIFILEGCKCKCSPRIDSGLLFFLIHINNLVNGLKSDPKIFVDDTPLFSINHDVNLLQINLNEDLDKINNWAYQLKMSFNLDLSKKAREVIFSGKFNSVLHPPLTFNNVDLDQILSQKHFGMFLDFKLSLNEHLVNV